MNWLCSKLYYGGIDPMAFKNNREKIEAANYQVLSVSCRYAILIAAVLTAASFVLPVVKAGFFIYLTALLIFVLCHILIRLVVNKKRRLVLPMMYLLTTVVLGSTLLLGTFWHPQEYAVTFIGAIAVLPVLMIDKPGRIYAYSITMSLLFGVCSFMAKELPVASLDIIHGIIFCGSGIFLTWNNIYHRMNTISVQSQLEWNDKCYRAILESAGDIVFEYDRDTKEYRLSESAKPYFDEGTATDDSTHTKQIYEEDRDRYYRMIKVLQAADDKTVCEELRIYAKDGQLHTFLFAATTLMRDDGRRQHIVGKLSDITTQKQQTEKIEEAARTAVVLSQIQPHFLYNALNTIQYLCDTQPQTAGRIVEKFAKYLRGNMDSLTQKEPIPLKRELAHLENYLSIERVRFDDLRIEYDIRTDDFTVPPLTLQPLVENAIRYGVTQRDGGGTVTVSAYEEEDAYVLCVHDDGMGFDPQREQRDGRSHIGINSTRERLEAMCHGSMTVESVPGEGTSVTLRIPKGGREA